MSLKSSRTATGATTSQVFLAVECSSDYWAVMWSGKRVENRFRETIVLSPRDAATVLAEDVPPIYSLIKEAVGDWSLLPVMAPGAELKVSVRPGAS